MRYVFLSLLCVAAFGQDISGERIRVHTKFLSSDLLEGRGVGARGGDLATEYIATQLALVGARPAGDKGTWFQRVPLVGSETKPSSQLSATVKGQPVAFQWAAEFTGVTLRQKPEVEFDGEAVFVGHGITAPEFHHEDYKDIDVKGKVVLLFTNEPPSTDAKFFGGPALTYYGRWTYKYEEAIRHGAAAVLILHTTPTAGYGWDVVRSSWGKEDPQVRLAAGQPALALAGWLTAKAAESVLGPLGYSVDELLKKADSPDFRAFPLNARFKGRISSTIREIDTRNVVGVMAGSDPQARDQAIVFSAHWDHLGIGDPVNGDRIYNGAVDNATGCAMLLELARAWGALSPKPRRTAIFVSVTAEEGGLRGSEYYGQHPTFPAGRIAANLNFDGFEPIGRTKDISVAGAERTTMWPTVQAIAKRLNFQIKADPHPEQGHYFRSDHFSMARVGIPAFSINQGDEVWGKPASYGEQRFQEYNEKHYHQPSDEYQDDWDFSGLEQIARFGLALGMEIANQAKLPDWAPGDSFKRQ
ncbi:MAG: M28 family peptidase [Acidobacteria bacterium]|nr:M28 family peptidase [Acidobacteriota bacterium]